MKQVLVESVHHQHFNLSNLDDCQAKRLCTRPLHVSRLCHSKESALTENSAHHSLKSEGHASTPVPTAGNGNDYAEPDSAMIADDHELLAAIFFQQKQQQHAERHRDLSFVQPDGCCPATVRQQQQLLHVVQQAACAPIGQGEDVQLAAEATDTVDAAADTAAAQSSSQHEMPAAETPAEDAGGKRVDADTCEEAGGPNREIRSISRSHLDCIICRELMVEVHALHCGHMFCGLCLAHWFKRKKDCPSCRTAVTGDFKVCQCCQRHAFSAVLSIAGHTVGVVKAHAGARKRNCRNHTRCCTQAGTNHTAISKYSSICVSPASCWQLIGAAFSQASQWNPAGSPALCLQTSQCGCSAWMKLLLRPWPVKATVKARSGQQECGSGNLSRLAQQKSGSTCSSSSQAQLITVDGSNSGSSSNGGSHHLCSCPLG